MTDKMLHRTTVLEKSFAVSAAEVFAVWAEVEKRSLWNTPSDDVVIKYTEDDFSVGGKDVSLCLVGDQIMAEVVGIYHDIVPDERIIYTEIIKTGEGFVLGISQVSVDISASNTGTSMVVTLQTVATAGADVLDEVAAGWTASMAKMEAVLAG
ncbi:MAG: hypothetical protein CMK09_09170 [Ponticaulis sp.]|nr:hypothetical protein [Ponticaulis sp.]|tara:strand:+ start:2314 stop:2772 length:459 start_codon:yes stop_codon:yes gene_type:complete